VKIQNDVYQQYVAEYEQVLLNANQDAENSLTAYLRSIEQAEHLRESARSASDLTDYLVRLFEQGYLPPGAADTSAFINQLFTAVNFQVQQQDAAAQAEGNIAINLVLLYRAMGGGWQLRLTGACPGAGNNCGEFSLPATLTIAPPAATTVGHDGKKTPSRGEEPTLLLEPITVARPTHTIKDEKE
jgi:hypothetical protein